MVNWKLNLIPPSVIAVPGSGLVIAYYRARSKVMPASRQKPKKPKRYFATCPDFRLKDDGQVQPFNSGRVGVDAECWLHAGSRPFLFKLKAHSEYEEGVC